jgi:hypothetical protein
MATIEKTEMTAAEKLLFMHDVYVPALKETMRLNKVDGDKEAYERNRELLNVWAEVRRAVLLGKMDE